MTTVHTPPAGSVPSLPVVRSLVQRAMLRLVRIPSVIMPVVIMPAFFVIAFTGSFDGISRVEGYPTDNIINWVAAFAMLQSCSFAGIGAAAAMAVDIEHHFIDRLLVSPVRRSLLIIAPLGQAAIRSLIPSTVVLLIAWTQGASMPGGAAGVAIAYLGGISIAVVLGCLALGFVLLVRTIRAMAIVQIVAFLFMFPSTGQVPIDLMEGWLATVARINPVTPLLAMTRQGFLGEVTWSETWPGLAVVAAGIVVFGAFAMSQLRRLER